MDLDKPYAEDIEWCTIVNEECEWNNCDGCPNNISKLTKYEENVKECEFVHKTIIDKILPATVNGSNTLGKAHMNCSVLTLINHFGLEKVGYSPINMIQYPLFFMLKKTLALGIPREIYLKKNETCVVMYEDTVYLIGPRIESK